MKELKLNAKYFSVFRKIITLDYTFDKDADNLYLIKADRDFFGQALDELSDYLLKNGLDENDEANSVGLEIETLIDYISEIYYSK